MGKCVLCADAAARFKMRIFARAAGPAKCETVSKAGLRKGAPVVAHEEDEHDGQA